MKKTNFNGDYNYFFGINLNQLYKESLNEDVTIQLSTNSLDGRTKENISVLQHIYSLHVIINEQEIHFKGIDEHANGLARLCKKCFERIQRS